MTNLSREIVAVNVIGRLLYLIDNAWDTSRLMRMETIIFLIRRMSYNVYYNIDNHREENEITPRNVYSLCLTRKERLRTYIKYIR